MRYIIKGFVEEWSREKFRTIRYPATITLEEVNGDQLPTFLEVAHVEQDGPGEDAE